MTSGGALRRFWTARLTDKRLFGSMTNSCSLLLLPMFPQTCARLVAVPSVHPANFRRISVSPMCRLGYYKKRIGVVFGLALCVLRKPYICVKLVESCQE